MDRLTFFNLSIESCQCSGDLLKLCVQTLMSRLQGVYGLPKLASFLIMFRTGHQTKFLKTRGVDSIVFHLCIVLFQLCDASFQVFDGEKDVLHVHVVRCRDQRSLCHSARRRSQFLSFITGRMFTEVRGVCRWGRHGVGKARRCVSGLKEAEIVRVNIR